MTEAVLKLSDNYTIDDVSITRSEFNKDFQTIVSKIYITLIDKNGKNGHISATCFDTPNGYQIMPKSLKLTYDTDFEGNEAEKFIKSLNNSLR